MKENRNDFALLLLTAVACISLLFACSGTDEKSAAVGFEVDPSKGRFDPAAVHVYGRVGISTCYKVVVSAEAPEAPVAGMSCNALAFVVRPNDGRLVYESMGELAIFEPEPWSRREDGSRGYPSGILRNDPPLDDSGCTDRAYNVGPVWTDPTGKLAYRCATKEQDANLYVVDGETIVLRAGSKILALGSEGRAMTWANRGGTPRLLIEDPDREVQVRTGWPRFPYASRSDDAGFLVAIGPRKFDENSERLGELMRVRYDGTSEVRSLYGGWPDGYKLERNFALAADGTLYAIATRQRSSREKEAKFGALLRFGTDGSQAQVLWDDETPDPVINLRLISSAGGPGEPPASE